MTETIELIVPEEHPTERLDKIISVLYSELSRSRVKPLIKSGDVTVNGHVIKQASLKITAGAQLTITIPDAVDDTPLPENIPLDIIYEDDHLLVINKAVGMVVHPGAGNYNGTLVNALLHHCRDNLSGIGGVKRPGIVHRLDKETSGLMIVAKHDARHQGLSAQLQDRSLSRLYGALVWKSPLLKKGQVDHSIGRHPTNRLKMSLRRGEAGRDARTHYIVENAYENHASHITCKLETGRTHQIRVHMQHLGHPLIGDPLYGLADQEGRALLKRSGYEEEQISEILSFPRQALHAKELSFIHPITEERMTLSSEWPDDWQKLKNNLKTIT